ncbi:MAG TPA: sulfite exporter TauE/SafE family protein [Gaiellaceae bacterium]|nr:sulfite exporter TauE/SafE family protein [Gaiellaceae bacterium]
MSGLLLAGVAVWCFVVALAGGMAGLVLGNIRLPVLLFAASNPAAASGANIAVSGLAAVAASVAHVRAKRVDWRLVAWMLPTSVAGAVGGGAAASYVPANALRILIGSALLAFGVDLLRPRRGGPVEPRAEPDLRAAVVSGAVIGVLGGLIGLILGSLRLPALIRWVGEEPARAVGTNLVVGIFVGAAGLVGHLPGGIDWTLLWVGAAGSVPGALLGARFTGRLSPSALLRAVGVILLAAGTAAILQGAI